MSFAALGTSEVKSFYWGSLLAKIVYLGDVVIWSSSSIYDGAYSSTVITNAILSGTATAPATNVIQAPGAVV